MTARGGADVHQAEMPDVSEAVAGAGQRGWEASEMPRMLDRDDGTGRRIAAASATACLRSKRGRGWRDRRTVAAPAARSLRHAAQERGAEHEGNYLADHRGSGGRHRRGLLLAKKGGLLLSILPIAIFIFVMAGTWRVYTKAGQPGWAVLIPIYNIYCLIEIAGRPTWWLLLFFIPIANVIAGLLVSLDVAANFGKGILFGLGLFILPAIFMPILGFGNAEYGG